ncbi:hypothetical protein DZ934_020690, partial [Pseudomonas aeruginosa]|nr:hypothetical protein [Pseudomonas aeruginosa]
MSNYALNIYNAWVGEMDKLSRSGRQTRAKYLKVRKLAIRGCAEFCVTGVRVTAAAGG